MTGEGRNGAVTTRTAVATRARVCARRRPRLHYRLLTLCPGAYWPWRWPLSRCTRVNIHKYIHLLEHMLKCVGACKLLRVCAVEACIYACLRVCTFVSSWDGREIEGTDGRHGRHGRHGRGYWRCMAELSRKHRQEHKYRKQQRSARGPGQHECARQPLPRHERCPGRRQQTRDPAALPPCTSAAPVPRARTRSVGHVVGQGQKRRRQET